MAGCNLLLIPFLYIIFRSVPLRHLAQLVFLSLFLLRSYVLPSNQRFWLLSCIFVLASCFSCFRSTVDKLQISQCQGKCLNGNRLYMENTVLLWMIPSTTTLFSLTMVQATPSTPKWAYGFLGQCPSLCQELRSRKSAQPPMTQQRSDLAPALAFPKDEHQSPAT